MSSEVTVRWAEPADAEEIASVHIASWQASYRGLLPDETLDGLRLDQRTKQWRAWLAPGGERAETLLAERDGAIAGFATLAMPSHDADEPEGVAEIPALYLDPSARRAGIGSRLVDDSLAEMRRRGFREAILWMLEGNDAANSFYERTGWRRDGGRRESQYYPDAPELAELRFRRAV
jgi:ribosomal protein S18 acetylase RimI-like enzyme